MKKIAFLFLGALALITITACNKDKMDEYGADKKISKVYYSYSYTETNAQYPEYNHTYSHPKTMVEQWNWNTDNLVESIENYNDDGGLEFIINFTYNDKHRVSRVDCFRYNIHLDYFYDEETKLMNRLDLFYGNQMMGTCSVTYKDNKMSQLTATVYDDDFFKKETAALNPFTMLLPKQISERCIALGNQLSERNENRTYVFNVQLTWTNNNIDKVIAQGMDEIYTITAQYDTKKNPVYGFILGQPGGSGLVENNIISVTMMEDSHSETAMVFYQYDSDDYPITATYKETYNYEYYSYTNEETLYFEYY